MPDIKKEELKLDVCPLCGGDAQFDYDRSFVPPVGRVRCSICGAKLWSPTNKETTVRSWNSRIYKRPVILKACPLCGVHASIRESKAFRMFSVQCDNPECGFSTRDYVTADGAIERWNSEPEYEEEDE